jgi:phospholipid/cholesterol/gamma-HCH transport system permease protein
MIASIPPRPSLIARIGTPLAKAGDVSFDFAALGVSVVRSLIPALGSPGVLLERFHALIVRAWPLVAITSFATGAALALQFGQGMARFGGKLYVPNIVAIAMVRALGPVFACLMVAARSGGGIAAELGAMRVTQQLDALKALGKDPVEKLVAPVVIVLAVGMPLLTFVSDVAGIAGGLLAAAGSLGIAPELYLQKTVDSIHASDLAIGLAKTSVYGALIALIACFLGMRTQRGTSGIGVATTASIVAANIFVLLADLLVTKVLWVLQW